MSATLLWTEWQKTWSADPAQPAVIDAPTGRVWTRATLQELVLDLASHALRDAGNRRIALCRPNSADWLAAFLAVQKQGGSIIPLDAGTPPEAQETVARQSGADWLDSAQLGLVRLRSRRSARGEVCIKLTSGSSGLPKRIPCQAAHLLADGRQIIRSMGLTPQDRNLALIPFGHSYGLGNLVLPLLQIGLPVVVAAAFVPGQIPDWICRHAVTVFPSVAAVFRVLAQLPGREAVASLRLAISAAAPLPPETARAFFERFGVRVHNFYGSSETGGICFDRTGDSSLLGTSPGRPLDGVQLQLRPNGQIRVSSPAVATKSGAFTLPDLGVWTETGELRLIGRVGQVANLGGKKVRPAEIEAELRKIPGVSEAWVTVLDQAHGHYLAAAVETIAPVEEIRTRLSQVLPDWKLPRVLKTLASLPRTERGKPDPARLTKWLEA